jgi:hypothetical protein
MVQIIQAHKVGLEDLNGYFKAQAVRDRAFFPEWQNVPSEITELERQYLDKIQAGYLNLIEHPPLLEKAVQVAILGPLLFLADFYLPPFRIQAEKSIEITAQDEDVIVRGQLDILLLKERFWAMAIESKEASFSFEAGRAQLLAYMLANPQSEKPCFGLISSGGSFVFLKLVQGEVNRYGLSRVYELSNPGNDLYDVYPILKHIADIS